MKFIEFCVHHAVPVIVGVLLAVLFGVLAMLWIPRQLTPTVEIPVIGLTVTYLGAAPQIIEQDVVEKIEEQLKAVEGYREMTSTSQENYGTIQLEFEWGTNLDVASIDVINKLSVVQDLPQDMEEPVLYFGQQWAQPVAFIALTGLGLTADQLREIAEDEFEAEFKKIEGVSRVAVYGGRERHVEAVFDPYKLAAYQLTPLQVSQVLAAENLNTRGGRIDESKNRWIVRTVGEFRTAEDVENVILRRPGMADLKMGELLDVSQTRYKDMEAHVRIDGREGVVFAVFKKTGENVVAIMQRVAAAVKRLEPDLARRGMTMEIAYDESEYIQRSIEQLQLDVIYCAVLAVAVLFFFLRDVRAILTIGVTIPVSFVATFLFLWLLGRTLNVVSLAGLAFAVGMLVDNSVVVLENIYRHREMGKGPVQAALDGASEVWGAVLASTLTTVAVFVPILFIQEEAGQIFRDIALAIAISVSLSLVFSMTVIPMLAARILKAEKLVGGAGGKGAWIARYVLFGWLGSVFTRAVSGLVRWLFGGVGRRIAAAALILAVFGAAAVFFYRITQPTYLPKGNRNFVRGFVFTEAGASMDHNLQVAYEIEDRIRGLPGVERFFIVALADQVFFGARARDENEARALAERIQATVGSTPPPFLPAFILKPWLQRNQSFIRQPIAGVRIFADQIGLFDRAGTFGGETIDVTVRGDDILRLYKIGDTLQERLAETEGVRFIRPSYQVGKWELRPTVDRRRAADAGFTARDVGYSVGALVTGFKVADFRETTGNELDLTLRGDPKYREHIETLQDVPLWTPAGQTVLVGQVAPVQTAEGYNAIDHTEQQRSVNLEVVLQGEVPMQQVIRHVEDEIVPRLRADGAIPPDYLVHLRGTAQDLKRMVHALSGSLLLALLITYLLMAALFESFAHPLVIMLSVPLAIVGGYGALWLVAFYNMFLLHTPPPQLDVVTMLGFVILIGIIVNNAILVVAQALNFHKNDRLPIREAIVASVESRMRPIFMSTLTTILGMMPLVLIPGPGSELYQGLGAVIVGGLAVSTVFTLILTPLLFSLGFAVTDQVRRLAYRLGVLVPPDDAAAEG